MTEVLPATPLSAVAGGKTAKALEAAFGYTTVEDLLRHYPRRYGTRGELTPLSSLPVGENVTVVAEIQSVRERPMRGKRGGILEVQLTDGDGMLTLTFFNQQWRARELTPGKRGMFAGKVGEYRGQLQLAHPAYELFTDESEGVTGVGQATAEMAQAWALRPIPIYPATATVTSWTIARVVALILSGLGAVTDPIPSEVRDEHALLPLAEALRMIHRPETEHEWRDARKTLRFHEAFLLQLALLAKKRDEQRHAARPRSEGDGHLVRALEEGLPFSLTAEQVQVGKVIAAELASQTPMHRLVQGEVGSGKTLVALRAMLQVAESGGQSALLAPTEVLAAQHLRSIERSLGPELTERLKPTLITGQLTAAEKKRALLSAASGDARIVVGTHALMSEQTQFYDLGLIVIDEQHRFGVEQREALRQKADAPPHILVLTATPIPRTIALTAFGDLDVSTIRNVPGGRAGIVSFVAAIAEHPSWEERAWHRAAEEIAKGRQVFVVCPSIDGTEMAGVEPTVELLRGHPSLSGKRIGSLTGAMQSDEKDRIMNDFAAGNIDLLVATTVIEVGVDVPNASLMIVRDADRFGISQLHQLRGRVGRGVHEGICIFVTGAELGSLARERVEAVAETQDGFALAEKDLELRQEGDVLGAAQSGGRSTLKLLRVAKDGKLIERAHEAAVGYLDALAGDQLPRGLSDAIAAVFGERAENIAKS